MEFLLKVKEIRKKNPLANSCTNLLSRHFKFVNNILGFFAKNSNVGKSIFCPLLGVYLDVKLVVILGLH